MSRVRAGACILLVVAASMVMSGCSGANQAAPATSQPATRFEPLAGPATMPLCVAYPAAKMKEMVGGGSSFRILRPASIGEPGDAVTGQSCSWQRGGSDGASLTLQIEGRDYGEEPAATAAFDEARSQTASAESVDGLGDAAFSTTSARRSRLQVRYRAYLLTASSEAAGSLDPMSVTELRLLTQTAIDGLA